jgi:putative membrane protein
MLEPMIVKNDRRARILIILASIFIFGAIAMLGRVELPVGGSFDIHIFAKFNAVINSVVSLLLIIALIAVKKRRYVLHKRVMIAAIILSVLFLVSYVCHHLFAGDTKFGGVGSIRYFYFFILITHIFLAAIILPFILFTAYRAMISEFPRHKKIARVTWPIWLYVSVTGVLVYLMISPYYA